MVVLTTPSLWQSPRERDPRRGLVPAFERAKHRVRLWQHRSELHALAQRVAQDPALSAFARTRQEFFHPLITRYLDRRLGRGQRLAWIVATLDVAQRGWGERSCAALLAGERVALLRLEQDGQAAFTASLCVNPLNWHEGYFAICLFDAQGRRIYNLSFGFTGHGERARLFIGSLQGPGPSVGEPAALIRTATRLAHGLRPPNLLLELAREVGRATGVSGLTGIDPDRHMHGGRNRRHRLRFDYRAFWTEAGGQRTPDGNWNIPQQTVRRALAEVPSQKRSMYRRRFAMLDAASSGLSAALTGATAGPAASTWPTPSVAPSA
jgi:uncharacterized protein VirK/YbjX